MKRYAREAYAPFQELTASVALRIKEVSLVFRGLGGVIRKNGELQEELIHLQSQMRDLEQVDAENIRLRSQLHFAQRSARSLLPAEVLGRDASGWWRSVRIGRGDRDGVLINDAVITSDGLIGKTIEVSHRTADVLLISDPSCKVSAQISRTGTFGILQGNGDARAGQAQCQMNFINKNIPVRVGDEVITSGLGGIYPRGLLIGYVEEVEMDASGLYQLASIIPKADLGMLYYVFVISEEDNTMAELLRDKGPVGGQE